MWPLHRTVPGSRPRVSPLPAGRRPAGRRAGAAPHPYEETFVLERGTVTFIVDAEELDACAGQIVVVPAGAEHRFVVTGEEPLGFVSVHPAPRIVQEDLEDPPA